MFEFLFKYPASVFSRGTLVLLGSWPRWVLAAGILSACAAIGIAIWSRRSSLLASFRGWRAGVIWALQSAVVAVLLLLLWEPAISVTALKPQQNIIAVLVDDSRSMSLSDGGSGTRQEQARRLLENGVLKKLRERFQLRLYRLSDGVQRVTELNKLNATAPMTQIGAGLRQIAEEAGTLPIGATVLLSDGADNTGGVDLETMTELRRRRLPVSTIGFGAESLSNDVEVDDLELTPKTLAKSRLEALVTLRQNGFTGKRAKLTLLSSGSVMATREIVLQDRAEQTEKIEFNAGQAGVKNVEVRLQPMEGESNRENNSQTRVLSVDDTRRRLLYVEGEPRWEFKFLRRAVEDDPAVQIVSMLRTTQSKVYRQGIANPQELADGFPTKAEDLFAYQGLIFGSVEAAYFSAGQQELIKQFVDRRGGGALFLGGQASLSDGGYGASALAELLPVTLPARKNTFQRNFVAAELTEAGRASLLCRIEDDADKSAQHWGILPYLASYQDPGTAKPGATVLARVAVDGRQVPLLITEKYGSGRTAVFATGGSWRWRMQQPVNDKTQETFWRQLLRWTVSATPSRVVVSTKNATLEDEGHMQLRAEVRDLTYQPAPDAEVRAHIVQPDGSAQSVELRPEPQTPGEYVADWDAAKPGSYVAEISATKDGKALGKDVLSFRREDGVAENFHREQNRDLLTRLAEQTGGRYYSPSDAKRLPEEVAYSEAGVTSREFRDLWNMPAVFLLIGGLRSAEWLLRRRWGTV